MQGSGERGRDREGEQEYVRRGDREGKGREGGESGKGGWEGRRLMGMEEGRDTWGLEIF